MENLTLVYPADENQYYNWIGRLQDAGVQYNTYEMSEQERVVKGPCYKNVIELEKTDATYILGLGLDAVVNHVPTLVPTDTAARFQQYQQKKSGVLPQKKEMPRWQLALIIVGSLLACAGIVYLTEGKAGGGDPEPVVPAAVAAAPVQFADTNPRIFYDQIIGKSKRDIIKKHGKDFESFKTSDCDGCTRMSYNYGELEVFIMNGVSYKLVYVAAGAALLNPAQLVGVKPAVLQTDNGHTSEWLSLDGGVYVKASKMGPDYAITCMVIK